MCRNWFRQSLLDHSISEEKERKSKLVEIKDVFSVLLGRQLLLDAMQARL